MKPIRLLPDARAEYDAAIDWYENRRKGLGVRFFQRIQKSFELIRRAPHSFPVVHQDVHKLRVRGFPYIIPYQDLDDEVLVIAGFHSSRDPSQWKKRVR